MKRRWISKVLSGLTISSYHSHFKLRLGLRHAQLRLGPPLHQTTQRLPNAGQFRPDHSAVRSRSVGVAGSKEWRRTLKLMFKALIASISVSLKSNEVVSRLDSSLFAVFVLGMTATPFCVAQRRRTWPGSVPDFRPCHTLQEERHTLFMGLSSLDDNILVK